MTTTEIPLQRRTPPPRAESPRPPTRNRSRIALGIFLVVVLSLAFAVAYNNVGERRAVLAVGRPVTAGSVISSADLVEARVSSDAALRPVAADQRDAVVGRIAAVNLVPGTLVTRAQLATGPPVEEGRAVVGLALKPGRLPAGLQVGERVLVVLTPPPSAAGASIDALSQVLNDARVAAVTESTDVAGGSVVSVNVPVENAATMATAAAADRVSLVLVGGRR